MPEPGAVVESLPDRPLSYAEGETLAEDGRAAPLSFVETPEGPLVFTVLVFGESRLYGLGFDDDRDEWTRVADAPASDEGLATLREELESWTTGRYDGLDHVERGGGEN